MPLEVGDGKTLLVAFANPTTGAGVDPATVQVRVKKPDGTLTTYTYAGAAVTRVALGQFSRDISLDQSGWWEYRWTATNPNGTEAGRFYVQPVAF